MADAMISSSFPRHTEALKDIGETVDNCFNSSVEAAST